MSGLAYILMAGGAVVSAAGGLMVLTARPRAGGVAAEPYNPTTIPENAAAKTPAVPLTPPPVADLAPPAAPVQPAPQAPPVVAEPAPVAVVETPSAMQPVAEPVAPAEPPIEAVDDLLESANVAPIIPPPPVIPPPATIPPVAAEAASPPPAEIAADPPTPAVVEPALEAGAEPAPASVVERPPVAADLPPPVEVEPPPPATPDPDIPMPAPGLSPNQRFVAAMRGLGLSLEQGQAMFEQAQGLTHLYTELPEDAALAARCLNIIDYEDPGLYAHEQARLQVSVFLRGVLGDSIRVIWPEAGEDSAGHDVVGAGAGPVVGMITPGFEYVDAAGARHRLRAAVRCA